MWKFCGKAQFPHIFGRGNCAFPQNFHPRKLGEIMIFYAVSEAISGNLKPFTNDEKSFLLYLKSSFRS